MRSECEREKKRDRMPEHHEGGSVVVKEVPVEVIKVVEKEVVKEVVVVKEVPVEIVKHVPVEVVITVPQVNNVGTMMIKVQK